MSASHGSREMPHTNWSVVLWRMPKIPPNQSCRHIRSVDRCDPFCLEFVVMTLQCYSPATRFDELGSALSHSHDGGRFLPIFFIGSAPLRSSIARSGMELACSVMGLRGEVHASCQHFRLSMMQNHNGASCEIHCSLTNPVFQSKDNGESLLIIESSLWILWGICNVDPSLLYTVRGTTVLFHRNPLFMHLHRSSYIYYSLASKRPSQDEILSTFRGKTRSSQ